MFEQFLFILGIYSLAFGRMYLPWKLSLVGWRARLAALFLAAPFPVSLYLGPLIGRGIPADRALSIFGLTELALAIFGIGGALLVGYLLRPKAEKAGPEPVIGKV